MTLDEAVHISRIPFTRIAVIPDYCPHLMPVRAGSMGYYVCRSVLDSLKSIDPFHTLSSSARRSMAIIHTDRVSEVCIGNHGSCSGFDVDLGYKKL